MSYAAVPNANLLPDKPIRSVDITQMNDNITDHEERLASIESPSNIDVHFERDNGYASGTALTSGGVASLDGYYGGLFTLNVDNGSWTEMITGSTTDEHKIRTGTGGGGGTKLCQIRANSAVYFDNRTGPITCTYRMKVTTNAATAFGLFVGFHDDDLSNIAAAARPTNGIFLETVDATHWRFTMGRAGAYTTGTQFTPPTASTWFEVQIIINDDAGSHAECYVDGSLKSDLSGANLPVDKQIFSAVSIAHSSMSTSDVDRFRLSSAGIDNAA